MRDELDLAGAKKFFHLSLRTFIYAHLEMTEKVIWKILKKKNFEF